MIYGKLTKSFLSPTGYYAVGSCYWFHVFNGKPGVWFKHPATRQIDFRAIPQNKHGQPYVEVLIVDPEFEEECAHLLAGGGEV